MKTTWQIGSKKVAVKLDLRSNLPIGRIVVFRWGSGLEEGMLTAELGKWVKVVIKYRDGERHSWIKTRHLVGVLPETEGRGKDD